MQPIRCEMMPGVYLNYVHATKFKTGTLRVQLITPLSETTETDMYSLSAG